MARQVEWPELTIVIPVAIDTPEREQNLTTVYCYLKKWLPTTKLSIVEAGPKQVLTEASFGEGEYSYIPLERFNRSIALNYGFKKADTEFIANYDTDVLFTPFQFRESKGLLKHYDFVFPYSGMFLKVQEPDRTKVIESLDVEFLDPKKLEVNHPNSLGGAIFARKLSYMEICYENPNFTSWGFEDNDRLNRIKLFGMTVTRANGSLFHLEHPQFQKDNKWYTDPYSSLNEANKLAKMDARQYRLYATWMDD